MLLKVLLVIATIGSCVEGNCDQKIVDKINAVWGGKPPKIHLQQFEGLITYVWQSLKSSAVKCFQTKVDCTFKARDYNYFTDKEYTGALTVPASPMQVAYGRGDSPTSNFSYSHFDTNHVSDEYQYTADQPGIITLVSANGGEDRQYIVYWNDKVKVYAYVQCQPKGNDYNPFVGVAAVNYAQTQRATQKAIDEAKKVLAKVGFKDGSPMATDCPSFV